MSAGETLASPVRQVIDSSRFGPQSGSASPSSGSRRKVADLLLGSAGEVET